MINFVLMSCFPTDMHFSTSSLSLSNRYIDFYVLDVQSRNSLLRTVRYGPFWMQHCMQLTVMPDIEHARFLPFSACNSPPCSVIAIHCKQFFFHQQTISIKKRLFMQHSFAFFQRYNNVIVLSKKNFDNAIPIVPFFCSKILSRSNRFYILYILQFL